jgi:4'-phosphopantetheinyl transferase
MQTASSATWRLGLDEVHVWHLEADRPCSDDQRERWRLLLSSDERQRYERFLFPEDRERFLVAHAATRMILSRYTGQAPGDLEFTFTAQGRPELRQPNPAGPRIRHNLSHTRGLIAIAVCLERDVGIDVESLERGSATDVMQLAERFFASPEVETLAREPADRRRRTFLEIWTLKEAYIKARGLGLTLALDGFAFDIADAESPSIWIEPSLDDQPDAWTFRLDWPTDKHVLAAAVRCRREEAVRFVIRPFEINDGGSMSLDQ